MNKIKLAINYLDDGRIDKARDTLLSLIERNSPSGCIYMGAATDQSVSGHGCGRVALRVFKCQKFGRAIPRLIGLRRPPEGIKVCSHCSEFTRVA